MEQLLAGPESRFADWPNTDIPRICAGVYTIWKGSLFVYVGMAGRKLTVQGIAEMRANPPKEAKGLQDRLGSHASGRRSGDQFCVYVCDRFVVPTLTPEQLVLVGEGKLFLDTSTKEYIHEHLTYRWVEVPDGNAAFKLERSLQSGAADSGKPLLNPDKRV